MTLDVANLKGTYDRLPERTEVVQEIQEALIIEFYNRKL